MSGLHFAASSSAEDLERQHPNNKQLRLEQIDPKFEHIQSDIRLQNLFLTCLFGPEDSSFGVDYFRICVERPRLRRRGCSLA